MAGVDDGKPASSDAVLMSRDCRDSVGSCDDAVLMSRDGRDVVGMNGSAVGDSCAVFCCLRALALRLVGPGLRPGFFFLAIS